MWQFPGYFQYGHKNWSAMPDFQICKETTYIIQFAIIYLIYLYMFNAVFYKAVKKKDVFDSKNQSKYAKLLSTDGLFRRQTDHNRKNRQKLTKISCFYAQTRQTCDYIEKTIVLVRNQKNDFKVVKRKIH